MLVTNDKGKGEGGMLVLLIDLIGLVIVGNILFSTIEEGRKEENKEKLSQMTKDFNFSKNIHLRALENQIKYFNFGSENLGVFDVRVRVLSIS